MMRNREKLTERIIEKSKELLGYEIDQAELRLMVYFQYVMTNEHVVNSDRISGDDALIIEKWIQEGRIYGAKRIMVTKKFWDIMNEIIFLGYVDLEHNY